MLLTTLMLASACVCFAAAALNAPPYWICALPVAQGMVQEQSTAQGMLISHI